MFIWFKFAVASISVWPPERKAIPGTNDGTLFFKHSNVSPAISSQDIFSFERTNSFKGKYHVLGGVLSPLDGIGPDDLNLDNLYKRVVSGMEVILATNPSVEGDTTCLYLSKKLEELGVNVTRLARGLPVGSDLEYMDELTLVRAMEGRTSVWTFQTYSLCWE